MRSRKGHLPPVFFHLDGPRLPVRERLQRGLLHERRRGPCPLIHMNWIPVRNYFSVQHLRMGKLASPESRGLMLIVGPSRRFSHFPLWPPALLNYFPSAVLALNAWTTSGHWV